MATHLERVGKPAHVCSRGPPRHLIAILHQNSKRIGTHRRWNRRQLCFKDSTQPRCRGGMFHVKHLQIAIIETIYYKLLQSKAAILGTDLYTSDIAG